MKKQIDQVEDFHKTFGANIAKVPSIPNQERLALRISLMQEELNEFKVGAKKLDIVECIDALCDLQYVLLGTIIEFGLQNDFERLFDEVHRSNLSKACLSEHEAILTVEAYKAKGVEAGFKLLNGKYIVYRLHDNKTLKSINYSEAKLSI